MKKSIIILGVFIGMVPFSFAHAYTVASSPSVPFNDTLGSTPSVHYASVISPGVAGSVTVYVQAKSTASTTQTRYIEVFDQFGNACFATTTIAAAAIPRFSGLSPGQGAYRTFLLGANTHLDPSATCASFSSSSKIGVSLDPNDGNWSLDGYNSGTVGNITTFSPWFLVTTDTATSTI